MYLRYPTSVKMPDSAVNNNFANKYILFFVSDETIWKLEAENFTAMQEGKYFVSRHLFFQGAVTNLSISKDGKFLAFSGCLDNGFDVYVMPVEGGDPIRCTFLNSADLQVMGWDDDGVFFISGHETPIKFRIKHVYHTLFDTAMGESKTYTYDGEVMGNAKRAQVPNCDWFSFYDNDNVIQLNGYGYGAWKEYKGGTAADLYRWTGSKYSKITESLCNCVQPVVTKTKDVYYLTDDNGHGNVYVYKDGKNLPITNQKEYCTLDLSYDNEDKLYYSRAGGLFVYDCVSQKEIALNISFKAHKPQIYPRFAHETDEYTADDLNTLTSFALNKDGSSLALTMRGQAFAMQRYVTNAISVGEFGYSMIDFLNDDYVVVKAGISEQILVLDKQYNIKHSLDVVGHIVDLKVNDNVAKNTKNQSKDDAKNIDASEIIISGEKIAFVNGRTELYIWDIKQNKAVLIKPAQQYTSVSFDWSPDGRYLAYTCRRKDDAETVSYITIVDTHTLNPTANQNIANQNIEYMQYDLPKQMWDSQAVFSPDGKYLFFLSNRSLRTSYDDVRLALNFTDTFKPYMVILQKDGENPLRPWMYEKLDDKQADEEDEKEDSETVSVDSKDKSDDALESVKIDFENIADRIIPLPIGCGDFAALYPINNGLMWARKATKIETLKKGLSSDAYKLEKFCFDTQKVDVVMDSISDVVLSGDKKTMAVVSEEHIKILDAGSSNVKEVPWKQGGVIAWSRIGLEVKQDEEFKLIFQQAFLFIKELFNHQDNRQPDWQALYDKYSVLLPHISCRSELNQLIREMQGELGTSHSYVVQPGDVRSVPEIFQGYLGGRLKYTPEGYEIIEIYPSRMWSDKQIDSSPLVGLEVGDKIVSIQGKKLVDKHMLHLALKNTANKFIQIEVLKAKKPIDASVTDLKDKNVEVNNASSESDTVTASNLVKKYIRPLSTDQMLLYYKWLDAKRKAVDEATNSQVGYIHVPDMDVRGYEQFCRDYYQQYHKKALIVDVRYNGGGHVSPLILDILSRKLTGTVTSKYEVTVEPTTACAGKFVFLCNEDTGSDGDIFSYHVKRLGLGPLIGKRTWGGVVGIYVRNYFIDGGLASQPEYAIGFEHNAIIENHGVDPDIVVENEIRNVAGVINEDLKYDLQLAKAVELIMKEIK